ncbi:MAG: hypothetical protein ACXVNN_03870, partial [Bacteroidia bacterium]
MKNIKKDKTTALAKSKKAATSENKTASKESKIKKNLVDLNYPSAEDIYNNGKETDLNPDDLSRKKAPNERPQLINEKDFNDDKTGGDLDVPGTELD